MNTPDLRSADAGTPALPAAGDVAIIRRLAHDYLGGQWPALAVAVLCMLATAALNGVVAWAVDPVLRKIFIENKIDQLPYICAGIVALFVIRAVTTFGQDALLNTIGERVVAATQRDMFRSQIRLDIGALNTTHSGELISKFLYDTGLLRDAITKGVAGFGKEIVTVVALVAVMLYQDWQLTLISILLLPPVAWVTGTLGRSLRKSSTRGMEQSGVVSRSLSEALGGRRIIKAYNLEDHSAELADRQIADRLRYLLKAVRTRAAAIPSTDIIGGIAAALTIAYAGYQHTHGQLTISEFFSFLTAMLLAQQPVRTLSQLWTISASGLSAANRIFAIIDAKPSIVDKPDAKMLTIAPPPIGGAVRFKDVSFSYGDTLTVDRISLEVLPGKKVALVGPSGAGKSTVFNLLLRFYDMDAGSVTIDNQNIASVTLASLREHVALVTQEPILFDETIAENIALGRPGASRDDIIAAAKAAAADDFITRLESGYDTRVGEAGLKLSGGQRQRIAIARAMLRNAPILLLDEATSALDTESERQVQDALATLMKDRTTIVIAHRLSTVVDADRIYVMDRGSVMESGTHGELLARNGLYARLYQHDFAGAEPTSHAQIG